MFIMNKIKNFISFFGQALKKTCLGRKIYCRLSSIDFEGQTAILHIINKRIFIKKTFSEIISNQNIIESLSSEHACWIGVYYGRMLRNAVDGKKNLRDIKNSYYFLRHQYGQYKIICENRDGTIGCLHVKKRIELKTHPLSIAVDKIFINYFDANQACYIGILAGINLEKNKSIADFTTKKHTVPYLRIVK